MHVQVCSLCGCIYRERETDRHQTDRATDLERGKHILSQIVTVC